MDMGYDDSNNVFSKNLGIIDFEGRFLYKIRHAGPVCGAQGHQALYDFHKCCLNSMQFLSPSARLVCKYMQLLHTGINFIF